MVTEQTVAINHARSEPFISLCRAARWNQNIRDTIHSQFSRAKETRWKRETLGGFKVRAFQNGAKTPKKVNARFIKYLKTFLVTSASHLLPVRHYQMYHFIWYNCVYGNLNWGKHKVKHKNAHQDTLAETFTSVLTSAVAACVAWSRRGGKTPTPGTLSSDLSEIASKSKYLNKSLHKSFPSEMLGECVFFRSPGRKPNGGAHGEQSIHLDLSEASHLTHPSESAAALSFMHFKHLIMRVGVMSDIISVRCYLCCSGAAEWSVEHNIPLVLLKRDIL